MGYEFSIGSFFLGLLIVGAGAAMVIWFRQIGDNFASGLGSYDKIKLYGVIAVVVGLFVMINLHFVVLEWLLSLLFG